MTEPATTIPASSREWRELRDKLARDASERRARRSELEPQLGALALDARLGSAEARRDLARIEKEANALDAEARRLDAEADAAEVRRAEAGAVEQAAEEQRRREAIERGAERTLAVARDIDALLENVGAAVAQFNNEVRELYRLTPLPRSFVGSGAIIRALVHHVPPEVLRLGPAGAAYREHRAPLAEALQHALDALGRAPLPVADLVGEHVNDPVEEVRPDA